MYSAEEMFG